MPPWRREVEASITTALGDRPVGWYTWEDAPRLTGVALPMLVLSMVGHSPPSADRMAMLARVGRALAEGGALVVVDHNRPRRAVAALGALFRAPFAPGLSPIVRWRRLAYPTAREIQTAGFCVERLRLAAGERIQVVFARRAGLPSG